MSADGYLIEMVREKARQKKIASCSDVQRRVQAYREMMQDLSAVSSGERKFSRDEMNERR